MDHANLIAIDVHTHAEVSCWNPFDNYGEEYDRAADKYFRSSRRPTIAETIAYYRERKMACVIFSVDGLRARGIKPVSNEEVAELAAENADVMIPYASTDPVVPRSRMTAATELLRDGADIHLLRLRAQTDAGHARLQFFKDTRHHHRLDVTHVIDQAFTVRRGRTRPREIRRLQPEIGDLVLVRKSKMAVDMPEQPRTSMVSSDSTGPDDTSTVTRFACVAPVATSTASAWPSTTASTTWRIVTSIPSAASATCATTPARCSAWRATTPVRTSPSASPARSRPRTAPTRS